MDSERFRFLYRQGEGTINRTEFWQASWPPMAVAGALMLSLFLIAQRAPNDALADGIRVAAAFAYLMFCLFALFLCVISQYFVSAKRFADRGKPPALAGLAPFASFLASNAHWYLPVWATQMLDAAAAVIAVWTIVELGFMAGKPRRRKDNSIIAITRFTLTF
jgi:uncharacterized membrane protein YhaH (DUF805 family)